MQSTCPEKKTFSGQKVFGDVGKSPVARSAKKYSWEKETKNAEEIDELSIINLYTF